MFWNCLYKATWNLSANPEKLLILTDDLLPHEKTDSIVQYLQTLRLIFVNRLAEIFSHEKSKRCENTRQNATVAVENNWASSRSRADASLSY